MRLGDTHGLGRHFYVAQSDERAAKAALCDIERHPSAERGKGEAEEVEARLGVERSRQGWAGDTDPPASHAGPSQRNLRDDGGETERRHREIKGAQPQRGQADKHAAQRTGDTSNAERGQRAEPAARDHDARRVGSDGQKADPSDSELASEANDEVEARDQHPVHRRARGYQDQEDVANRREGSGGGKDQRIGKGSEARAHQTRRIGGAPNSPCGAAIKTTMKATKTATETSTPPNRKLAAC